MASTSTVSHTDISNVINALKTAVETLKNPAQMNSIIRKYCRNRVHATVSGHICVDKRDITAQPETMRCNLRANELQHV